MLIISAFYGLSTREQRLQLWKFTIPLSVDWFIVNFKPDTCANRLPCCFVMDGHILFNIQGTF